MAFPRLLPGHQMSLSLGLMAVSSSSWFLTATSDKKKRKKDPMLTNHDFGFTARLLISCGVFSIDELIQRDDHKIETEEIQDAIGKGKVNH